MTNNTKTKVLITTMSSGVTQQKEFITGRDAYNYFLEKCQELGYSVEDNATEAGGIGHDYRIELID